MSLRSLIFNPFRMTLFYKNVVWGNEVSQQINIVGVAMLTHKNISVYVIPNLFRNPFNNQNLSMIIFVKLLTWKRF